jgi:hypothetical protein
MFAKAYQIQVNVRYIDSITRPAWYMSAQLASRFAVEMGQRRRNEDGFGANMAQEERLSEVMNDDSEHSSGMAPLSRALGPP